MQNRAVEIELIVAAVVSVAVVLMMLMSLAYDPIFGPPPPWYVKAFGPLVAACLLATGWLWIRQIVKGAR